jgi:hypothetical protein
MLKDARHTAEVAQGILEIVCSRPFEGYAYAITRILRAQRGAKFTHGLDVGIMLQKLVEEELLKVGELVRGKTGRMRRMYKPTWKAFLFLRK